MPAISSQLNDFIMPAATPVRPARLGLLGRIFASLQAARMREAERQIARLIEHKGGRLTDDIERQIERHFV